MFTHRIDLRRLIVTVLLLARFAAGGVPAHAQTNWRVEVVPTTDPPTGGAPSLAFDPADGYPSIAYKGALPPNYGMVLLAHWNGSAWVNENVGLGDQPRLRFDHSGRASVLFRAAGKGGKWELRLMTKNGSSWTSQTIDTGILTYCPELRYDAAGNPSTVYKRSEKGNSSSLVLARRIGSTWTRETLEMVNTGTGLTTTLAYDPSGYPSTAYTRNGNIVLARRSEGGWVYQTIEAASASYLNLSYTPSGNPVIVYSLLGVLRYLAWDGAAWVAEDVAASPYPQYASLAMDDLGTPYIAFSDPIDENSNIKYGTVTWKVGANWVSERILTMNIGGISMAMGPTEVPAVAFFEGGIPYSDPENLWYAVRNSRP